MKIKRPAQLRSKLMQLQPTRQTRNDQRRRVQLDTATKKRLAWAFQPVRLTNVENPHPARPIECLAI
jgi:hypothetical protein